jgi:crossover junction endodeoxyribonuclease RusA
VEAACEAAPQGGERAWYTPKATRDAEQAIRDAFIEALPTVVNPTGEPIAVELSLYNEFFIYRQTLVDDYKNRRLRGDCDNYAKAILDSLNCIAYVDDKQIVDLRVRKL